MGRKSRENGNKGESIVIAFLKKRHYWAHLTKRNFDGSQPVDLIALRKKSNLLLDSKFVSASKGQRFPFEDIEVNQKTSMKYAREFAEIENVGFAIVFEGDEENIRFLHYDHYIAIKESGRESARKDELPLLSDFLEE